MKSYNVFNIEKKSIREYEIKKQEISAFYKNNQYGWVGVIFLVFAIYGILRIPFGIVLSVYLLLLLVGIFAHIRNHQLFYRDAHNSGFSPRRWEQRAACISSYSGLLIGTLPIFFVDASHQDDIYLITTLLIVTMFGSSVVSANVRLVHMSWVVTSLLPMTIFLLASGSEELWVFGIMIIFAGMPVSFLLNNYNYRLLHQSLSLSRKNSDLVALVQGEKEKAERANEEKSRFLAAASHDLRQPLYALNLYLGAMRNQIMDGENFQKLIEKALASSDALTALLESLMDISRMDSGEYSVEEKTVNLKSLVEQVVNQHQALADEKSLLMTYHAENQSIQTDPVLFTRVLRNLIVNALQHSRATKLSINASVQNEKVVVEVSDNGCGIARSDQQQVFLEFLQLENPERDRAKGLGLGLAIVKRICNLLGAEVSLESQPNQGCCFRVVFAHHVSLLDQATLLADAETIENLAGKFIVVVDDERDIRSALSILLKQWGCEVLLAGSLTQIEQELDAFNYPEPDLLMVDYRLKSGLNGFEVVTALRKRFNAIIPTLIITGDTHKKLAPLAEQHQCQLLFKPVTAEQLKSSLLSVFYQPVKK